MTRDPMPVLDQPREYCWSLWSRWVQRPSYWEYELQNTQPMCERLAEVLLGEQPDREVVILPPGEMP